MHPGHRKRRNAHYAVLNLFMVAAIAGLNLLVLFGLPLMLGDGSLWIVPAALFVILVNAHWALVHEAMHGALFRRATANALLGRGLSVLFGSQFRMLRYGHLLHHRLARDGLDGDGSYDPNERSTLGAMLRHYLHLFGGLYVIELASTLLIYLPTSVLERTAVAGLDRSHRELPGQRRITDQQLLNRDAIREMRQDGALTVILLATSFSLYGEHWSVLLGLMVLRGLIISLTDSSFHYQPPKGADHQSMNFRLPVPFNFLVLNFNYHRVHHRHPGRPWYELPALKRDDRDDSDYSWALGLLRQLRGPVVVTGKTAR